MKPLLVIGLLLLTLASCVTQKRCFEKFPPQVITKDSVVLKDTTIYVKQKIFIPKDSVILIDTLYTDYPDYYKESESASGKVKASVEIKKGILKVDCQVDSLTKVIDSLKVELQTKESYHKETQVVEKVVTKVSIWMWLLLGALFSALIVISLKNLL